MMNCLRSLHSIWTKSRYITTVRRLSDKVKDLSGSAKVAIATEDMKNIPDPDVLFGSDTEKTSQYADSLPSLPLADLSTTLSRYLQSTLPHLTEAEYKHTENVVREFQSGIGKELQQKLQERASKSRNWLEEFWENYAYLDGRYPICPLVNVAGPCPYHYHYFPAKEGTQLERAGMVLNYQLRVWKMLRRESLKPEKDNKGNNLCMNQYSRAFNSCRIPALKRDKLIFYFQTESQGPCPNHLTVFYHGRVYTFSAVDENDELLTAPEIQHQLQRIKDSADKQPRGPGLAALTSHNRTTWAQLRSRLLALHPDNYRYLEQIQTSILSVCLSDCSPADLSDMTWKSLQGDSEDRWADKSPLQLFFSNGLVSMTGDHAPVDGMVLVGCTLYIDAHIKRSKGKWHGSMEVRDLPHPEELRFHIDDVILKEIEVAKQMHNTTGQNLKCLYKHYKKYGKTFLRSKGLHPDTHMQLALQHAYYKLYQRPAPTYETATARKFYHGRTETMKSCTVEAIDWCKAMLDPNISREEKLRLYLRAASKHNTMMVEAQNLQGCDRHLLGLYCIAHEAGLPVPELYQDPAYTKSGGGGNYILSTSFLGYAQITGSVAPMTENGYGTFYRIEPTQIVPIVTSWRNCTETNADTFCDAIFESLDEMGQLVNSIRSKSAKL